MTRDPGALEAAVLAQTVEELSNARTLQAMTAVVLSGLRTLLDAEDVFFDLYDDLDGAEFDLEQHNAASIVAAPVRRSPTLGRARGTIGARWPHAHQPSATQLRLLQVLAASISSALEGFELCDQLEHRAIESANLMARTDELESALYTMVHDMRSPLGAMMGYAELVEEALETDPDAARAMARSIVAAGQRMSDQIDLMLSLYRLTNRPLQPTTVDLSEISRDIAGTLRRQLQGRAVDVQVENDLKAVADPVLARLVMENLLANAFKYTGHVDSPVIEVGCLDSGTATTSSDRPMATFFVRDNGAGFDAADADKLFRPLTRLHKDDEFPGTGLGLASVARIVQLHGGEIHAEGERAQGASFIFSLPLASAS